MLDPETDSEDNNPTPIISTARHPIRTRPASMTELISIIVFTPFLRNHKTLPGHRRRRTDHSPAASDPVPRECPLAGGEQDGVPVTSPDRPACHAALGQPQNNPCAHGLAASSGSSRKCPLAACSEDLSGQSFLRQANDRASCNTFGSPCAWLPAPVDQLFHVLIRSVHFAPFIVLPFPLDSNTAPAATPMPERGVGGPVAPSSFGKRSRSPRHAEPPIRHMELIGLSSLIGNHPLDSPRG